MPLKKYLQLIPAAYFMLLSLFILIGSILYNSFQVSDVVCVVLLMLPMLIRKQWLYGTFGFLSSIVWTVFLIQVFVWFNKMPQTHIGSCHYTISDFIVGFVFCSVSVFFSAALFYQACYWQPRKTAIP